jgi:hypothetical protein
MDQTDCARHGKPSRREIRLYGNSVVPRLGSPDRHKSCQKVLKTIPTLSADTYLLKSSPMDSLVCSAKLSNVSTCGVNGFGSDAFSLVTVGATVGAVTEAPENCRTKEPTLTPVEKIGSFAC